MKIIAYSNFDNPTVSDILIAENVNEFYGKKIVEMMNEKMHKNERMILKLVVDDYKLYDSAILY